MVGLSLFATVVHELRIIRSRITPNETSTVRLDGASPANACVTPSLGGSHFTQCRDYVDYSKCRGAV
jgi:hypothetical protein